MKAITLFSSAGIGDLAIRASGIEIMVANELLSDRASLHKRNFPETEMLEGDIWKIQKDIVKKTKELLKGEELDFIFATPPCQGMSKNGQGKLLNGIRNGNKNKFDARNQLIIPTLDIITSLRPKVILFENVPEMKNTVILDEREKPINIIDYIKKRLGPDYLGKAEVVQFADFGVPQRRTRLITIFSRANHLKKYLHDFGTLIPKKTHSRNGQKISLKPWVTVRNVIEKLPKLDSRNEKTSSSNIPFHRVPVLDEKKYWWISNTPPEKGAFNNQCINPKCKYDNNPAHGSEKDDLGINKTKKNTPLYCEKCGELLPRPSVQDKQSKKLRIMSGYTSAYKRMSWDLPSSTLTTNLSYPCSDQKLHPEQNRVLSLFEAFQLHTLDQFPYTWENSDGKPAKDTTIREVIGESIPPKAIQIIVRYLKGRLKKEPSEAPVNLLSLIR